MYVNCTPYTELGFLGFDSSEKPSITEYKITPLGVKLNRHTRANFYYYRCCIDKSCMKS